MEDFGDVLKQAFTSEPPSQEPTQVTEPIQTVTEPVTTPTPPTSTEPVQTTQVPTSVPTPVEYWKNYGYEKEEDLKSSLNELNTLREATSAFEQQRNYYTELEKAWEEMSAKSDESSLFSSPEEYKNFLTAQKLGLNKDHSVVQKIIRSDLNQLDDLDVLSLRDQYDIPRFAGKDDKVKRALLEEMGVDVSDPDFKLENYKAALTEDQELKLARLAKQTRDHFEGLKSGVTIPEKPNPKAIIQERIQKRETHLNELSQSWKANTERVVEAAAQIRWEVKNEKGEVADEFVYATDAAFKDTIPEIVDQFVIQNDVQPTPENIKGVVNLLKNAYIVQNWDKILASARNDAATKLRDQLDKARYNGQPVNTTTAPPDRKPDEKDEISAIAAKLAGL